MTSDLLKDRVILITGAGQGLGRAAALACAAQGATVILHGLSVAKLETVYDQIVAAGGAQPAIFPMDLNLATEANFEEMAQAIGYQFGHLDGICHCAALFEALQPQGLETLSDWMNLFRVNAAAPAAINRACLPWLQAAAASVVLVGESHGHAPVAYWGGFAVSKAALEAYFKVLADEWSDTPMRVNLLIPGPIASPQRAKTHPGEDKAQLPTPEAVADKLVWLLSDASRAVRGQLIEYGAA
jgi:NAD(P)-dependent dehydrogenase (short-subunit alcohol dehydrogenase family)